MLKVEDVVLTFGGIQALDQVSLTVPDGQICGLIGPNGAGKTSLFNCVTRIYLPSVGRITFDDRNVLGLARHQVVEAGIARTFQNLALFRSLSVMENAIVGAHSRKPPSLIGSLAGSRGGRREMRDLESEAWHLLGELDLRDVAHRPAEGLPFGTLKRVELARALMARPRLILLDEPAGGLTHAEVHDLGELIKSLLRQYQFSALLVEHHMGLVMSICDRVVALDFGRVVAEGLPADVQRSPEVVAAYLGRSA